MYRGSSASAAGRGQCWLRLFGRRLRLQPAGGGEWFKALRWRLQSSGGRARVGPVGEASAHVVERGAELVRRRRVPSPGKS